VVLGPVIVIFIIWYSSVLCMSALTLSDPTSKSILDLITDFVVSFHLV